MKPLLISTLAVFAAALPAASIAADPASAQQPVALQVAQAAAATDMSQGEVRRISKETKKITLRHGEIRNLEMPAMSMVFNVRDVALLDTVKVGDQVDFVVVKDPDGSLVVTTIKPKR